jgi:hypothetical protein
MVDWDHPEGMKQGYAGGPPATAAGVEVRPSFWVGEVQFNRFAQRIFLSGGEWGDCYRATKPERVAKGVGSNRQVVRHCAAS